jgi:hypothetical protein
MLVDMNVISGSWAFSGPVQSVLDRRSAWPDLGDEDGASFGPVTRTQL